MTCHTMRSPNGGVVIACSRGSRAKAHACHCGLTATKLCDGRVPGERGRTRRCDRPICDKHATPIGDGLDHCPECVATAEAALAVTLPSQGLDGALVAYTDGSGTIATKPCGAGVVVYDGGVAILEASPRLGNGTNNYAELMAVRFAVWMCSAGDLRARQLLVRSDSMYAIDSFCAKRDPPIGATNREVIAATRARIRQRGGVWFEHVKGHSGNIGNERADVLAGLARLRGLTASAIVATARKGVPHGAS